MCSAQVQQNTINYGNQITDREFQFFQKMIYDEAGITISDAKKSLVTGRLAKRLRFHRLPTYTEYLTLLGDPAFRDERQTVIDLLTTNETYFFREPKHFEYLEKEVLPEFKSATKLRLWTAACSSGEEPYTLGMVLNENLGANRWEILASDISTQVLARAREGLYPEEAIGKIPKQYLYKYCLKGVRSQAGKILMDDVLRKSIEFRNINLIENLPAVGQFDVIFLRNVMIYFNPETKRQTVARLLHHLRPGGYFFVSHAETLHGITSVLRLVAPSVYRKVT